MSVLGEHPLMRRHIEGLNPETLDTFTKLLSEAEIEMDLADDVYFNVYVGRSPYSVTLPDHPVMLLQGGRIEPSRDLNFTVLRRVFDNDSACSFPLNILLVFIQGKASGKFKIPNAEVMADWSMWITGGNLGPENIFMTCVNGPTTLFAERWPLFMQATLHPKLVAKERGAISKKTPERLYHIYLVGALQSLRPYGWELEPECRTGLGYILIRLQKKK
jgi:hypothetical protein